jgi:hypothetical protein
MKASANVYPEILFGVAAAPGAPGAGQVAIYAKTGGGVFAKDAAGTESPLGATGLTNPMTTAGDMIVGGTAGTPTRTGISTDGYIWMLVSGLPAWAAPVSGIPQNSQSAAYTLLLSDNGKHIYHPSADTTARTWTIPANASVAFPLGSAVTFVNDNAAGVITIAITTDTMRLAGAGTTGSRTLAANGVATAIKLTSTSWQISGTGLT